MTPLHWVTAKQLKMFIEGVMLKTSFRLTLDRLGCKTNRKELPHMTGFDTVDDTRIKTDPCLFEWKRYENYLLLIICISGM